MARISRRQAVAPNFGQTGYRVAVYIRLSVEDNKNRGNSLESQRSIIENHIALNPDFEIFDTYIDNGTTGVHFEREGFKRMLQDIESGKINCIVVKDLSRLGRNVIDTGYYIEKYFPLKNVRFISVNDNFDSADKDNIHNGIILPLKNMVNEAYSLDIAKKIRTQAEQAMKAGDFIGARPPYGYLKSPDNCHKLIIDPEAAAVVRQIFEWANDKVGLNRIVVMLNEAGILPPSQYKQKQGLITNENQLGQGKWQTRTVNVILSNQVYVGDMVQGKSKSVKRKSVSVGEKEWITVLNTHEPIIAREVFEAVKAYRNQVADDSIKRNINPYTENILKGKIFCGDCGKSLNRHRRKGSKDNIYDFYCLTNSRVTKGNCNGVSVRESEVLLLIASILQKKSKILVGNDLMDIYGDTEIKETHNDVKTKIFSLNKSISQNRAYLKSLYENLIKQVITETDYAHMKNSYEEKITTDFNEIKRLETKQSEIADKCSKYQSMIKETKKFKMNGLLTAVIVNKLIEKVTVNSADDISVIFKFDNEFGLKGGDSADE